MIIVTENKKQHYIIKNFLAEISTVRLNENESYEDDDIDNERHYVGFYPIINKDEDLDVTDKEVITQDQPITMQQLQKAAKVKPKMINLAKLVKSGIAVSILAAASYFASDLNNNKVVKDIAKNNNIPAVKVIEKSPNIIDDFSDFNSKGPTLTSDETNINLARNERQYDGEGITQSSHPNSLYNFEGFRSTPYEDAGGESIGFGTQLFRNINKKGQKTWQEVFFLEKLGKDVISTSQGQKSISRNGQTVALNSIQSITRAEAREAADTHIPASIEKMHTKYSWSRHLPRDAQLALLDMIYNMGPAFNMRGVRKNMEAASKSIQSGNFKMAIKYLETAKKEIIYKKPKDQMEYDGENPKNARLSAYAVQQTKSVPEKGNEVHRRPLNTLQRIDDAINVLESKIQNESFSIRSVYQELFNS